MNRCAVVALLAACCVATLADHVKLKNGNRIRGRIVEDTPKQVVIKTGSGTLTFPRRMVKEVVREAEPEPAPQPAPPTKPTPPSEPQPASPQRPPAKGQAPYGGALKDNFWARMRARGVWRWRVVG